MENGKSKVSVDLDVLLMEEELFSVYIHAEVLSLEKVVKFVEVDAVLATETSVHKLVVADAFQDGGPFWVF